MSPPKSKVLTASKVDANDPVQDGSVPHFICVPCGNIEVEGYPACIVQENEICQDCFDIGYRPQFETYLKDENSPILWAGQPISIDLVKHQFSPAFIKEYQRRMEEYAVKPNERLYCSAADSSQCGSYLGEKTKYAASRVCLRCGGKTCTQ